MQQYVRSYDIGIFLLPKLCVNSSEKENVICSHFIYPTILTNTTALLPRWLVGDVMVKLYTKF